MKTRRRPDLPDADSRRRGPRETGPRSTLVDRLPVTEHHAEIAGVPTVYLEGGPGPPVVLLHGPGESALWWMRVIPELVTTHQVVVPDLPGQGASGSGDGEAFTVDGMLTWLDGIAVPTTLIWGRHDRALRLEIAEEASERYGWPLHVIDDARDDPKLERPGAFMEALRTAL